MSGSQQQKLDQVTIVAPAFTMSAVPHWVAFDKGFFREERLDISMEYFLGERLRGKRLGDNTNSHSQANFRF